MPNEKLQLLCELMKSAGTMVIDRYYPSIFTEKVTAKVAANDLAWKDAQNLAHNIMASGLRDLYPDIPVLFRGSDEFDDSLVTVKEYWLVEAFNAAMEYPQCQDWLIVNAALIQQGQATVGLVGVPNKELVYYAAINQGAYKAERGNSPLRLCAARDLGDKWRIVSETEINGNQKYISEFFSVTNILAAGSLQLCAVAEGNADLCPSLGLTSGWDTAAAQVVVEEAGGKVLSLPNFSPMRYSASNKFINQKFMCFASGFHFKRFLELNEIKADENIVWHKMEVNKAARSVRFRQKPVIVWFTGLSGSGKSTSASALEKTLFSLGYSTYLLDGDNVRHGLSSDLGFSDRDRSENIRRVGEVAKLMLDAGIIVLASFISPFIHERTMVRKMVEPGEFIEVYLDTPLSVCEARDPKGLYKKARAGQLKNFTGIDSPYEAPLDPEIKINTHESSIDAIVEQLVAGMKRLGVLLDISDTPLMAVVDNAELKD